MSSFSFSDLYLGRRLDPLGNMSGEVDEISFEINSNVSNADLLELCTELKNLQPEKIQCDLIDAMRALQELALQR